MNQNLFLLIPMIFPMLAGILIPCLRPGEKLRNWLAGLAVATTLGLVLYLSIVLNGAHFTLFQINSLIEIKFQVDRLSILFALLVSTLWLFTTIYAMEYMKHEGRENRFFAYFFVSLGVTLGIALAGNLVTLYLFYELLTLATYPLVIHAGTPKALASGRNYLIYSFAGATAALAGMLLVFRTTGSLDFIPGGIVANHDSAAQMNWYLAIVLTTLGFGVKTAIVPFHSWLPQAMVAPTPVSALLHAVAVVKSGLFAVIRTIFYIFGADVVRETGAHQAIAVLVILSILMGSFLALRQENLKMRLAYSTISQLGYVLLGLMLLNREALVGALMQLLGHALIKITLFYCAGAIMYQTHKTDVSQLNGLGRTMPYTMISFTLASVALVGIPPTKGFVSKWILVQGALESGNALYPAVLLISALLTALYLLPVISHAFFRSADPGEHPAHEAPWKLLLPIFSSSILTIALGLFPNPVRSFMTLIALEVMP